MPLAADQLVDMQQEYVQRLTGLWNDFFAHPERTTAPIADPRFSDPTWQKNSLASFYARTYLLNSEFMTRLAESVQGDHKTRKRVKFAVSQWVDAASPANFLALNPKAQQTLLDTSGESLKAGTRQPAEGYRQGQDHADRRIAPSKSARTSRPAKARSSTRALCSS